ncbi:Aste57867_11104 [Aphanomyces stellatus]|uniref:Aste57867_11104 protein n=1 Tax=Aphanomyces stellatus TaxID=120398 RepID=A0A485KT92_9STRA|nr:hypothetical protein As57867_011062 [Aphanomyces stellatus]VFT87971.1 Aste57867_11104 [Aphanomyces stellatus]
MSRLQPPPSALPRATGEAQPLIPDVPRLQEGDAHPQQHLQQDHAHDDVGTWILEQWYTTLAFEAKAPIPLHVAAMAIGLVVCAVLDKMSYRDMPPSSTTLGSLAPLRAPSTAHVYTWYHVLAGVVLFDILFLMAWMRAMSSVPFMWQHLVHALKAALVVVSQGLFFSKVLEPTSPPFTWSFVCLPLAVWTALCALQRQWYVLLGLTVVGAALKADGELLWDWALVFAPIWLLLSLLVPLGWLLPHSRAGEDPSWTIFKKWFWLAQVFCEYLAAVPLVMKLNVGPTLDDWFPYRSMVAVWMLPVTCVAILTLFVVLDSSDDYRRR